MSKEQDINKNKSNCKRKGSENEDALGSVVYRSSSVPKMSNSPSNTCSTTQRLRKSVSECQLQTGTVFQPLDDVQSKDGNEFVIEMIGAALCDFPWYHGMMPRCDCEELLTIEGDFLVRRTKKNKMSIYCLSIHTKIEVQHFPLRYHNLQWHLNGLSADVLDELLNHLIAEAKPLGHAEVVLKKGIARPDYYILHDNIELFKKLGGGAFGEVYVGRFRKSESETINVAVKKIKGKVSRREIKKFIQEAKLMKRFCHPNIVRLYGIAPQEEPIMIILELAPGGSLQGYFSKYECSADELFKFMLDACRGMCYLSLCKVIHRDLAARNCLLGINNELKIGDFGLSISGKNELKLRQIKSVPVKWLAPECFISGIFSTKTDVWSYGVLVWEIYNRCKSDPFPTLSNAEAKAKIISQTPPMLAPEDSPEIVQTVMNHCFVKDPKARADFVQILKLLAPNEKAPENIIS